ncbi:MAG: hypothetical protein ACU837_11455 [Gammaproteobacteria bacterium]
MKTRFALGAIASALMILGQAYVSAAENRFIVENKFRNPALYVHQNPDKEIDAYGRVDVLNFDERVSQIKILFPEIYSRFFNSAGRLKPGYQWIDYQKAIQAHYLALKDDAGKLYGKKSSRYKQIAEEIEDEEFNLGVARYFDNKFGNFTSSRSNFLLNVIPADLLRKLNQAGVKTASQLKMYDPAIYRQYIASKQLQADFYLGPIAEKEPKWACRPETVLNPICKIDAAGSVQEAAKAAAICARTQGNAQTAAKIAAQTAQQIGAGKQDAAVILSAIGNSLNLNTADRNRLAYEAAKSMCNSACVVADLVAPAYLYPLPSDLNALDAARLAAQYAENDPANAVRIAAETSLQTNASVQDNAMIVAFMMDALQLDAMKKSEFIKNIEAFNCTPLPQDLNALLPGAGNETSPGTAPGGGFDNPNITNPGPVASPN